MSTKSILFIKTHKNSLRSSETFLSGREWAVYTATDIKVALALILQRQPQYILLPVDHANKKLLKMPAVLRQMLPIHFIFYSENPGIESLKKLQQFNEKFKIMPPVSGPAIERMINKINNIQEEEDPEFFSRIERKSDKDDQVLNFKNFLSGENSKDILDKFQNLISEHDDFAVGDIQKSGDTIVQKGSKSKLHQAITDRVLGEKLEAKTSNPSIQDIEGRISKSGVKDIEGRIKNENKDQGEASLTGIRYAHEEEGFVATPPPQGGEKNPIHYGKDKIESIPRYYSDENFEKTSSEKYTLIEAGTQVAMDESSQLREPLTVPPKTKIDRNIKAYCITINSARFSGYLVAAMRNTQKNDDNFIKLVKQRLFKFLKDNGEPVKENEPMKIKIESVDFKPWAKQAAEFLRYTVHMGEEVAVAFFPNQKTQMDLKETKHKNMMAIDIKNLKADAEVEFDLYVYLPTNDKFVLYTPKGGRFLKEQKGRLETRGLGEMHLRKDNVQDVHRYKAQVFLNEKISEYRSK